jgi:hypothetical protein
VPRAADRTPKEKKNTELVIEPTASGAISFDQIFPIKASKGRSGATVYQNRALQCGLPVGKNGSQHLYRMCLSGLIVGQVALVLGVKDGHITFKFLLIYLLSISNIIFKSVKVTQQRIGGYNALILFLDTLDRGPDFADDLLGVHLERPFEPVCLFSCRRFSRIRIAPDHSNCVVVYPIRTVAGFLPDVQQPVAVRLDIVIYRGSELPEAATQLAAVLTAFGLSVLI